MVESGKARASKKGRKRHSCGIGNEIWKDFPEDLFEGVLARVPIATFFRFRSVCRKWNSLLTSQSFTQLYGEVKHEKPWFYGITNENVYTRTGAMYDPSSNKWHHPTLPAFPTDVIISPVASAGGLICFADYSHISLYMCNPLTRSYKELPASSGKPEWPRIAVGMTQTQNGGYKILCVDSKGNYHVYDSAINSWICPGRMPPHIKLPPGLTLFTCGAVAIEGRLCFMQSNPDGLLSYDVDTGMWRQYIVPAPPHMNLYDCALAEGEGRIMLVGLRKEDAASCVCIWELEMTNLLWKEFDRMPKIWCGELYRKKYVSMRCLGNKAFLMLILTVNQMDQLFTYDLSSREWRKLYTRTRKTPSIDAGTTFHPC